MSPRAAAKPRPAGDASATDPPAFARVIAALSGAEGVACGRVFASTALQVNGKIFAMFARGALVVKLPRARVEAIVASGRGGPFDAGKGRPMKEWVSVPGGEEGWVELAREALRFVRAG